ncbi:MAG TPA: hypothetical protein VGM88_18495 [Kofleriaceae bacterium]|jgi:hypothetical protein
MRSLCLCLIALPLAGCATNSLPDESIVPAEQCTAAAKLIYVIDESGELLAFEPPGTFTSLGYLDCKDPAPPQSMSIDRHGVLWILKNDHTVWTVDPRKEKLECEGTGWDPMADDFAVFGMAFSTYENGGDVDTLYISGSNNSVNEGDATLGSVDVTQDPLAPEKIATVPGWPELTGNSMGELWGFFPTNSEGVAKVGRIDKETGVVDPVFPIGAHAPTGVVTADAEAWAFGFYGGNYYIFLAAGLGTTNVYEMHADGTLEPGIATQHRIAGAGVSTCAPIVVE